MRAGFYTGNRTYEVREVADQEVKPDEVKIRVAWCGLCGTDVHKFAGKNGASVVVPPIILGHECAGVVERVGSAVRRFKPGDRVAVDPSWGCGCCEFCQKGLPNFCAKRHGVAKGFAEYVYPPEKNVYRVPDGLDLADAAFAEPLSCVMHGLDLLNVKSGGVVAIYGMGSIGLLMLQMVRLSGAGTVIAVEREAEKRNLALRLKADHAVDDTDVVELSEKINIDYVIECVGLKRTMEQALRVAGKNAKVLLFGLGDPETPLAFNQYEAYTKELSIHTSYLNPHTMARALQLLGSGLIETKSIVSARLGLAEMGEELQTLANFRKGKVLVRLSGEH